MVTEARAQVNAQQPFLLDGFEPDQAPPAAPNAGNGRPKGARNRKHRALEQAARSRALPLLAKVITAAENGDMMAAKIIFDRIWPKPRTAPMVCDLPKTETAADVRTAMLEVLQRVSTGEITSDDGAALVRMMRDILDAHSIKTLAPEADQELLDGDIREQFAQKLGRIIEARAVAVEPEP
jgi:hypothetical protein